jgi:septal ring factor EnvC (AmiA/AmiB activator)
MKKLFVVLVALAAVLVCTGVAIVVSEDHQARKEAARVSEVQKLKSDLGSTQNTLKLTNDSLKQVNAQTTSLTQQKAVLCGQIKTARLNQPLCN